MKITVETLQNRLEQLEVSLDGVLDRIKSLDSRIKDITSGQALYVDADKALVSSRPSDLAYIRDKMRAGDTRFKEYSR